MKKRILSIVLSVCMVLSLMPAFTLTASAGTITISENQTKEDGDLLITEDTTINIAEGTTYTVPNIVFQGGDGNQRLTITGGGTLNVPENIQSIGSDITIILESSILDSVEIMPGTPEVILRDGEGDKPGIKGYNVNITAEEGSSVKAYNITGGMGSAENQHYDIGAEQTYYASNGDGGDVNLEVNGASLITNTITYGEKGSVGDVTKGKNGKVNIRLNNGYLESTDYIKGGDGGALGISSGGMFAPDLRDIQPTDGNSSPVYPVTISVPTNLSGTYLPMTYKLDGGAEISTKAKERCLNLWLTEGAHKLIISESNKKMYSAAVTVTSVAMGSIAAVPVPLIVKNGDTTSCHDTWVEAIQSVTAGGTITLMEDDVPFDGFPEVDCTIEGVVREGGNYTTLNPSSSAIINMKSNITLKNIYIGRCLSDALAFVQLITGEQGEEGHLLTVEGNVNLFADGSSIWDKNLTGSKLIVNGDLYCGGIYDFETVKTNSGSTITTDTGNLSTKNLVNDGKIKTKRSVQILGGTLSGNGTVEFSDGFNGGRLQFKNGAKIASDSAITLEANFYTPAEGDLIAINIPNEGSSPSKVENIEKLRFDSSAYGDLMLAGSIDTANNRYQYRLAPAMSEVINGGEVTRYASWEEAAEAVKSGGTIKLLNGFAYHGAQINMPMPDVEFTIDGGGFDFATPDEVYPKANITLKDVNLTNGTFYGNDSNGNPHNISIEGSVTNSSIGFSGIATGSSININGNLTCNKIENFYNIIIGQNGKLEAKVCTSKNHEINGGLVYPDGGEFAIDGGVLSGSGYIDLKGWKSLQFYNMASIGENSQVTIKTNTLNGTLLGKVLIENHPIVENTTSTAILNIEKLRMGDGIDPLKLEVADERNFSYRLKEARTFTLEDKTAPYTGQIITLEATAITPALNGEQIEYKFYETDEERQAENNGTTSAINVGTYYVRAKIASTDSCLAKYEDATLTITKAVGLEAPTNGLVDDNANTFTFTPVSGQETLALYEYSFDGTTWTPLSSGNAVTSQSAIVISVGNVSGTIKVRLAESSNYQAGNILTADSAFTGTLEGQVNISGSAVYGQTLTANVIDIQPGATLSYHWKKTVGSTTTDVGTNSDTYTLVAEDIGSTIKVEVTAQEYTGSIASAQTSAIAKASAASAPSAPEADLIENGKIALKSNSAYQYKLGNGNWQDSNTFIGLASATGYQFFTRIKETGTNLSSEASEGKIIYTRSLAPNGTVVSINYEEETISFDSSKYEMNTEASFQGTAILDNASISSYFGQDFYIRVKAVLNGAPESASTQISLASRPGLPWITGVDKELTDSFKINATVSCGGINLYRVDNGTWQHSPIFSGLSIGQEHTFEVKQKAMANMPGSETAEIKKTWNGSDFEAADIASKIVSISAPAQNATNLTLPSAPAGFTLSIKSVTPDTSVVTTTGAITPPASAATVNIVLTVKKTSDSTEADTQALQVIVPAKSVSGNGGNSSSGGGGSSSGGGSAVIQPSNNVTVTAKTSGNGGLEATVSNDQIKDAVAAASKNGEKGLVIKINTNSGVNNLSLGIPQSAFSEVIKGNIDELKISSNTANLTFDKASLETINKNLSGDLSINMEKLNTASLSKEAQEKIKDRPVYDFTVKSGDKTISEFGGNVKVDVPYTLKAGENPNFIVIYYIADNGELTEVPNCVYDQATGTVSFVTNHFSKYGVLYNEVSFNDVSGWCRDYVKFLAARNIIKGTGANTFSPEKNITRAEFVTILANLSGQKLSKNDTSQFSDVSEKDWYFEEVQWAYENKIITGANGKFNPKETITRQDMALIIARYAENVAKYKLPETTTALNFTDSDLIASYTTEAVKAMQKAGIISGNSDGSFAPKANATRAQTAKMITVLIKNMVD